MLSKCNVESMGGAEENGGQEREGRGKPSKEVFGKEKAVKEMKEKRKKSINKEANVPLASAAQTTVTPLCNLSKEHIPTTTGRQILKSAISKTF